MYGYNIFDLIIRLSVALSLLMTVALLVALVVVRSRNAAYFHRRNILNKRWRGVFKTAYTNEPLPQPLPEIEERDLFSVLCLFVQFHDIREKDRSRSSQVFPKLDELAKSTHLDEYALLLLQNGDDADKIIALKLLGQIRNDRALNLAVELTKDPGAELSRAAAYCALRIAPGFVNDLLQLVIARDDWARSSVESMVREIDPEVLGSAMHETIARASDEGKTRLLDYVRFAPPAIAREICTDVLAKTRQPEVLAAALRSLAPLANASDRDLAIQYAGNANSIVVLSALRVLRKCVRDADRELLIKKMSDRDYWVRLRAAEAAVELLGKTELVEAFAATLADRFARDAIQQVLAERAMVAHREIAPDRRASLIGGNAA